MLCLCSGLPTALQSCSFISFVCLMALSHLLEIMCLSEGKGEGGKEIEWELSPVSLSGSCSLILKISLKLVEIC